MLEIQIEEKNRYEKLWKADYQRSACAFPLAYYIDRYASKDMRLLDIGCGDGSTAEYLRALGYECWGLDITLAGCWRGRGDLDRYIEAPVWHIPFEDKFFDYTFSTDLMEHLPEEMVEASIKEIYRVTRKKTFHCIATFNHIVEGVNLHRTVKQIDWWAEKFHLLNTDQLAVTLKDRDMFLGVK